MAGSLRLPGVDCPCGSGRSFATCCRPVHRDLAAAADAEAVMRARYSAFARGDVAFLRASWDPLTCPAEVDADPDVTWTGLDVVDRRGGGPSDDEGEVAFVARYQLAGRAGALRERSRFRRIDGCWRYVGPVTPAR